MLRTSSASQRTNKNTTMRFGLGWTKISSYLPTLISKEIGTIFSALQPSPPFFPYSTSIVWHVSRRLRVLSLAFGLTASQTTEWWWWCRPHPVREHAQDLRPPLGARPASPPHVKQHSYPHGVRPQIPDR